VFVGRADLVRRLQESACTAHLLVGEPGIGKSRVLEAFGDVHTAQGGIYVAASVYAVDTGFSFEPLQDIAFALHRKAALQAELLERVKRSGDPNLVRHVRDAISAASARAAIAIAVDDVFRLPLPALEALAYLVDRLVDLPVRWYFTSHFEHQVASAFGPLVRRGFLETHELRALSPGECDELVRSIDPSLEGPQAQLICERSGGNPFFAKILAQGEGPWQTATLRAAIAARLGGLSIEAQRVALLLATGRHATRERLAVAAGIGKDAARAACEELAARSLLATDAAHRLRFQHDLIAEAMLAAAPEPARSAAYETWLTFAEDAQERIRCLEGAGRWSEAADELLLEGWRAAEGGQANCETLLSRALAIVPHDDGRRAEIFAIRARYHVEAGNFAEARGDVAAFVRGREAMTRAAFAKAYGRFALAAAPEFGSAGLPLLDALLAQAPAEFPGAYPSLAHARALVLYCEGDVVAALDVVRTARQAPATALERLRQEIWDAYLRVQIDPAQGPQAALELAAAGASAEAIDATAEAARAYFMCAFIAHREDDLVAAEAWCRRGLAAPEPKPRSVVVALRTQLCEYLLVRGQTWEALGMLLRAGDETKFLRRDARLTVGALLALAQGLTGSLEAARLTLSTLDGTNASPVVAYALETIRGFLCEMDSQFDLAANAYDRVIAGATAAETSLAYAYMGRARIALGRRDRALLERLHRSAAAVEALGPKSFAVTAAIAGFLQLLAGDEGAIASIVAAIGGFRSAYDAAFVRLVTGEIAEDAECLKSAASAFDAMGTQPLADRARAAARRCGLRLGSPRKQDQMLSERLRSVAIGITAGQTNAEIAAALHLSPRTVEKHVSALLSHFGVRSRVEIAGIFLRGDVAPLTRVAGANGR
jgi:ATP/maltotriose-dependent transcriptional regulator MalT